MGLISLKFQVLIAMNCLVFAQGEKCGLDCYECSSNSTGPCDTALWRHELLPTKRKETIIGCPPEATFCFKQVKNDNTLRSCYVPCQGDNDSCTEISEEGCGYTEGNGLVCFCNTDLCNKAARAEDWPFWCVFPPILFGCTGVSTFFKFSK